MYNQSPWLTASLGFVTFLSSLAKWHGQICNVDEPWSTSPRIGQGLEINDLLYPISRTYADGFNYGSETSSMVLDI